MDMTHSVENVPALPPDMPATDPGAPKVALTQEQIAFLAGLPGKIWPTMKAYAPWIVMALGAAFGGGVATSKAVVPTDGKAADVKPADPKPADQTVDMVKKLADSVAAQQKQIDAIADMMDKQNKILNALVPKKTTAAPPSPSYESQLLSPLPVEDEVSTVLSESASEPGKLPEQWYGLARR